MKNEENMKLKENTFICFKSPIPLAILWTKIDGDLIWYLDEEAPLPFDNSDIY